MDPLDAGFAQQVGQTIGGRWTLRRLIGAGGMAAVYAADSPEGHVAAVKLLYPEMARRRDIRERFLREAAVMARIVHPGMVTIFEQGQSTDQAYLVMELLTGETVADRVRRTGRLDVREVLVILDQILDVLALAHSMGVIHRDLKPENLFLTQDGRIKVLDFGLARLLDATADSFRTRTGAALGTLPYMAPEQALGRRDEVDARTDIFAVGATAFRLLTGRRIHEAPSEAELLMRMASQPAPPLAKTAPDLPADLGAVVDRALAFAKTRRYPDAVTMQNDVRALLAGRTPDFALACWEREEVPTMADRQAPAIGATVPLPPNSTRPLHAALQTPPPPLSTNVRPTAMDPPANPTQMDPATPISHRIVPATVVMPASVPNDATVAEPASAKGATIPAGPVSDIVLERRRRRTLIVGLSLLVGLLGVATAATFYLFLRSGTGTSAPEALPIVTAATPGSPTPPPSLETNSGPPRMRHPAHIMSPIDELPSGDSLDSAPPAARHRRAVPSAASPAVSSAPASGAIERRADFVPEPTPTARPGSAANASPLQMLPPTPTTAPIGADTPYPAPAAPATSPSKKSHVSSPGGTSKKSKTRSSSKH